MTESVCRLTNRSLASRRDHKERLPRAGSVIAASCTSPLDCLYLAAVFDPLFVAAYPNSRAVQAVSLWQAVMRALQVPQAVPPPSGRKVSIGELLARNPNACLAVQPECTPSSGCAVLPLSPCLAAVPASSRIFPLSIRYTPADVATPVPGQLFLFVWQLCSRATHQLRVRLGQPIVNRSAGASTAIADGDDAVSPPERDTVEAVADALARLGRVSRVGLTVHDKLEFLKLWSG